MAATKANAPERAPPTLRADASLPVELALGADVPVPEPAVEPPEVPLGELEPEALDAAAEAFELADEAADETADEAFEVAVERAPEIELNTAVNEELAPESVDVGTADESVAV